MILARPANATGLLWVAQETKHNNSRLWCRIPHVCVVQGGWESSLAYLGSNRAPQVPYCLWHITMSCAKPQCHCPGLVIYGLFIIIGCFWLHHVE